MAKGNGTVFTDPWVRALGEGEYFDQKTDGLGLRVSPLGKKTFFVRRHFQGRQVRRKIGVFPELSLKDARAKAKVEWVEIERDPHGQKKKAPPTFGKAAARALQYMAKDTRPRTIQERDRILRVYLKPWNHRPVDSITRDDVVTMLEKIEGPVMANRVLSMIRTTFNCLYDLGLAKMNPALRPKRLFRQEAPRERLLTPDEMKKILKAAQGEGPEARAFLLLLAYTAQRAGAIAQARWEHIDLEAKTWRIPPTAGTKFRKWGRVVPLNQGAMDALSILAQVRPMDGFLFPGRPGAKQPHYTGWNNLTTRLRKSSGVDGWTMHDWRSAFATHGEKALGIDKEVLGLCLGHTVQGVTFTHYIDSKETYGLKEKAGTLEAWGGFLTGLLQEDTP